MSTVKSLLSKRATIKDMSLVPFTFNEVALKVVTIDSKEWVQAKEVSKALEYEKKTVDVVKAHISTENFAHRYELTRHAADSHPVNWPKDSRKDDYYINEEGLRDLVLSSQQPQVALLAETLGINVHKHKYMSKENDSIEIIMETFDGEEMIGQFHIGKYCIDLYFSEHKLAIECDEFGHNNRDASYEVNHQKFIEEQLQCQFVHYNPDAQDFDVVQVLNKIFRSIKI